MEQPVEDNQESKSVKKRKAIMEEAAQTEQDTPPPHRLVRMVLTSGDQFDVKDSDDIGFARHSVTDEPVMVIRRPGTKSVYEMPMKHITLYKFEGK